MSQDAYLEVNASRGPAVELLKSIDHGCGFGEFNWCQFEKSGCRPDELGGDIAAAAGTAHVIKCLLNGGHVEFLCG